MANWQIQSGQEVTPDPSISAAVLLYQSGDHVTDIPDNSDTPGTPGSVDFDSFQSRERLLSRSPPHGPSVIRVCMSCVHKTQEGL